MAKYTILKAWSELEGFIPLIVSPSNSTILTNKFEIDFSVCESVDSCGATAFLLKTLQYLNRNNVNACWKTNTSFDDARILPDLIELGFFLLIQPRYEGFTQKQQQKKLFDAPGNIDYFTPKSECLCSSSNGIKKQSLPIIRIPFHKFERRRDAIKEFKQYLFEAFDKYSDGNSSEVVQTIFILYELAKNTADHTNGDAFFGVDFIISPNHKINFLYGDLGCGIKQNITSYLRSIKDPRCERFSLADAYHEAFKEKFTTRPDSGENFGMGLNTVLESAKANSIQLSVFDASSRGLLSHFDRLSHGELRKCFLATQRNIPFCYFGSFGVLKHDTS